MKTSGYYGLCEQLIESIENTIKNQCQENISVITEFFQLSYRLNGLTEFDLVIRECKTEDSVLSNMIQDIIDSCKKFLVRKIVIETSLENVMMVCEYHSFQADPLKRVKLKNATIHSFTRLLY